MNCTVQTQRKISFTVNYFAYKTEILLSSVLWSCIEPSLMLSRVLWSLLMYFSPRNKLVHVSIATLIIASRPVARF